MIASVTRATCTLDALSTSTHSSSEWLRPPRPRPQDQADFDRTRPHLDAEQRAWLRWALVATQPEHPWIEQLASRVFIDEVLFLG